jgi:hypothetical protein
VPGAKVGNDDGLKVRVGVTLLQPLSEGSEGFQPELLCFQVSARVVVLPGVCI